MFLIYFDIFKSKVFFFSESFEFYFIRKTKDFVIYCLYFYKYLEKFIYLNFDEIIEFKKRFRKKNQIEMSQIFNKNNYRIIIFNKINFFRKL